MKPNAQIIGRALWVSRHSIYRAERLKAVTNTLRCMGEPVLPFWDRLRRGKVP